MRGWGLTASVPSLLITKAMLFCWLLCSLPPPEKKGSEKTCQQGVASTISALFTSLTFPCTSFPHRPLGPSVSSSSLLLSFPPFLPPSLPPPSFHHLYMPFFFPFSFHVSSTFIWPALVFWSSLPPDVLGLTDFSKNCPPQPRSLTPSFPFPPAQTLKMPGKVTLLRSIRSNGRWAVGAVFSYPLL